MRGRNDQAIAKTYHSTIGFERKDGKPIEVRFNVENLFDLNYWASASVNNGLAMGTPRTFLLSVGTRF